MSLYDLQVALVGKTAEPIIKSVHMIGYKELFLIYSNETQNVVKKVLKFFPDAESRSIDQYDIVESFTTILDLISNAKYEQVALNISGGSKLAAIGALMASTILAPYKAVDVYYLSLNGELIKIPPIKTTFVDEEWLSTRPQKKKLLFLIYECCSERGKIGFKEVCRLSKLKKSTVSDHMSSLKLRGLVNEINQGNRKYYVLAPRGIMLVKKLKVAQSFC